MCSSLLILTESISMDIVKDVQEHIESLFEEHISPNLTYHNLQHTIDVVEASKIIGEKEGLTQNEMLIVLVAAWFHDAGYINSYMDHEEDSKKIASDYLKGKISEEFIDSVNKCIDATKMPQQPGNRLEAVLADADAYHLSQKNFVDYSMRLRQEWNNATNRDISKRIFLEQSLFFIENHEFKTQYGKNVLNDLKLKNILLLKEMIKEKKEKKEKKEAKIKDSLKKLEELEQKLEKKKKKSDIPGRGIESMFRLTARNQINLSSIADNKANIMITINSLILSAVVTLLVRKIGENPNLLVPTFILFFSCITTIVFAILATRPKISSGKFTREDIKNHNVNLLFFGNFYNMELEEYEWAVKEMMKDPDYLYGNMIKDQYSLGKVLARKYKMIRTCYTVFMFGFIASIIAFAITFIYFSPAN